MIEVQLTMLIFELLDLAAVKSFHLELKGYYFEQYFSKGIFSCQIEMSEFDKFS